MTTTGETLTACITHPDMPEAEYHARPELSASIAKRLIEPGGPARWKWEHDNGRRETKAFDMGHAAHKLVLGVGAEIAVIPDDVLASNGATSTKAAKEFIAAAREAGQIPLKAVEHEQVQAMALALFRHKAASALLAKATEVEVSAFLTDPATGVGLRARFDAIGPEVLIDYKTSVSADPDKWRRDAVKLGYHIQGAHYRQMAQEVGITDGPLRFIVQEKTAPYLVSVIRLDDSAELLGQQRMREAIAIWQQCHETGIWPGYGEQEHLIALPDWAYRADDELDAGTEAELLALLNPAS